MDWVDTIWGFLRIGCKNGRIPVRNLTWRFQRKGRRPHMESVMTVWGEFPLGVGTTEKKRLQWKCPYEKRLRNIMHELEEEDDMTVPRCHDRLSAIQYRNRLREENEDDYWWRFFQ